MMSKAMQQDIINSPAVAYYSGWGGIEIKSIEYGIDDCVVYVGNAWYHPRTAHKTRIYYTLSGSAYFNYNGHRIPLDECIRC